MIPNLENLDGTLLKKLSAEGNLDLSTLPGMLPSKGKPNNGDFRVRYQNLCVREPGDIAELERLETKALRNEGVYVMDKKEYVFMDQMWILIRYIERVTS